MKHLLLHIAVVMLALGPLSAIAQDEPRDTVYFYDSWETIFYRMPDTVIVAASIDVYSPHEIYITTRDKKFNKKINMDYIAATMGDSTWLINSNYLKKNFGGDSKNLHGYVTLFFNAKAACAIAEDYMFAEKGDVAYNVISTNNYYIDFSRRKVIKIDSKTLGTLLSDYPELRMRFEGMADNKKSAIINYFFDQYIDRIAADPSYPDILDLVDDDGGTQIDNNHDYDK